MSGHCPKITPESLKEVLEFDAEVYGAGLYDDEKKKPYEMHYIAEDVLSLYQALKKASHFHPVIEILRRDAEVMVKRLYGTIPKQEWQPETAEQKLACLVYRKDHGKNPTRKEMQKIIDDIKERKFEVK